jgi:hypothetical protein
VSTDQQIVGFEQLGGSDLVIDRIYQGGKAGNTGDDPLGKLLPVGNQGGFRMSGSPRKDSVKAAVLYTSGAEPDWPDALDPHTGAFTYFGDNRSPGRLLEDTPRGGNLLLSRAFERAHGEPVDRAKVPPFLLAGKGACPPEDCGGPLVTPNCGVPGYADVFRALAAEGCVWCLSATAEIRPTLTVLVKSA